MNLDLTKQTFFQAFTFSIVVITLYWSLFFAGDNTIATATTYQNGYTFLGNLLDEVLDSDSKLRNISTISLQLFNVLLVSLIFIRNVIHIKKSHITSLIYVIVSCGLMHAGCDFVEMLATFLMLQGIKVAYRFKKLAISPRIAFLSSFLISSAALLYWPVYIGYVVITIRMTVYQRFYIREIISIVAGVLFPPFLLSYIGWLSGESFTFYTDHFLETITTSFSPISLQYVSSFSLPVALFIFVLIFAVVSLIIKYNNSEEKRVRIRNSIIVFSSFLSVSIILLLLFNGISSTIVPLISIPISLLFALYFNINKNIISSNIVFLLIVTLLLISILTDGDISINDSIEFVKSLF